nr:VP1 [Big Cypress virus]
MAVVTQDLQLIRESLQALFPGLTFGDGHMLKRYYRFSLRTYDQIGKKNNIPVIVESTWEDIAQIIEQSGEGDGIVDLYEHTLIDLSEIDPEEEFLRNYKLDDMNMRMYPDIDKFVRQRMRSECAVYGDLALRHWFNLLCSISQELGHVPLGLKAMVSLVRRYGAPFRQNTRDLAQISDEVLSSTIVLFTEMSMMEAVLEFNIMMRIQEENLSRIFTLGDVQVDFLEVIRELYRIMIPHPKKINNSLRAVYSWFVKCWGTGNEEVVVLKSRGGDDRNSKDVSYQHFERVANNYSSLIQKSQFHRKSLRSNQEKLNDTIQYSQEISGMSSRMPIIERLLERTYILPFDPRNQSHVLLASLLLSIQTMSGYGRAWVVNAGDDADKIVKPTNENYIHRVNKQTEMNFIKAYTEAERHGYTIVPPHEMYSSLLRLAKNTSSGMATTVEVQKSFGPRSQYRDEVVKITSRQKAMVIMREGDKIYKAENLTRKFNTPEYYQTKGSRDVPIKSTRTIYAIHISVLAPQLLLTLPLNEYFAQAGGSTTPSTGDLAGKIIIGDLEATGSRVMDAADTFRNTSDPCILTLALDYSEYDSHMTPYNFRTGMISGMRSFLKKYHAYRYEGYSIDDLIEFGYGDGRVMNTLWNGKRRVVRVSKEWYSTLSEGDRVPPEDAPFKIRVPGILPIRSMTLLQGAFQPINKDDLVLVSPWDGSDLARVTTHLSGENSTLIANSLHNMAIGKIMQEELDLKHKGVLNVLSEMYVGDDTLFYISTNTRAVHKIDAAIECIFDTVKKCGHEASAAKTTFLPFSAEKTQTHAKNGIYIPQDRMMVISSERPKNIENVQGYMRSNVMTYVTKVSRGFSERLARWILMFKASLLGYRKLKRTIYDTEYRSRQYFSDVEDGFTLCLIRDPLSLLLPIEWNGFGASPIGLNVVMTPELICDMMLMPELTPYIYEIIKIKSGLPPNWDETQADKRQLRTLTPMSLFSKLARPAVVAALSDPYLSNAVKELPLQGMGPHDLSNTMMHSALLKEQRARSLLSPGYELEYQKLLNDDTQQGHHMFLKVLSGDMVITSGYTKIFNIMMRSVDESAQLKVSPDQNLSHSFKLQKAIIGNRTTTKIRMSYVDKIDSIIRGDVIMRGYITSNLIIRLLEEIGTGQSIDDLATLFQLMNIERRVAQRLADYVGRTKIRFDTLKVNRGGIAGDEFSMSLNVCTKEMYDKYIIMPHELQQAERDAIILHISQLYMVRSAVGMSMCVMEVHVNEEHKKEVREKRLKSRMPSRRRITKLCSDIRNLVATMVERQFL